MLKRATLFVLAALALLIAAIAANTLRQGSRQLDVPLAPAIAVDEMAVADKLAGAVRFHTVADVRDAQANAQEFRKLHAFLEEQFPRVHATLKRETVGGLGLLYTWQGTDPGAKPVVLMAHQDVVPLEPGSEAKWFSGAFDGVVRDGYVWGRGTWDDKGNIVAQLEAVESLLQAGFKPRQTVYLAFGADEEVGGLRGAKEIAALLQSRGVKAEFVLDEGLFIADGMMPGLTRPVAIIGIAEKGYVDVRLKASGVPGHASAPPPPGQTAIAKLGTALRRLDQEQMPARLEGVAREMFETLAPEMGGMQRVALSNLWLFRPLVLRQLQQAASTNAMVRTTTALTIVGGGNKSNVIPGEATAVVNFRIIPGETRQDVLAHVREKAGEGVEVTELPAGKDPTGISPTSAAAYRTLARTQRSLFPDVLVAPALFVAGSDSSHFTAISDNIYRYSPIRVQAQDLPRLHGTNERIATANLADMVRFYRLLLTNLNAPAP
jgi:carboxypeptidase PM20D1